MFLGFYYYGNWKGSNSWLARSFCVEWCVFCPCFHHSKGNSGDTRLAVRCFFLSPAFYFRLCFVAFGRMFYEYGLALDWTIRTTLDWSGLVWKFGVLQVHGYEILPVSWSTCLVFIFCPFYFFPLDIYHFGGLLLHLFLYLITLCPTPSCPC